MRALGVSSAAVPCRPFRGGAALSSGSRDPLGAAQRLAQSGYLGRLLCFLWVMERMELRAQIDQRAICT